jgi:protein ImuA
MTATKADIISRLKLDILPLEGFRMSMSGDKFEAGLGFMHNHFPQGSFPLGAIHEFISDGPESSASTAGFISGLVSPLMNKGGAGIWIGCGKIYPPALQQFGIDPSRIIFIRLSKEKDLLWAIEESLKCHGLAAVIADIPEISFTASRRFQLAVEQSQVTGFIHRSNPRNLQNNAAVSRWRIKPAPTESFDALPGLGFPRWQVELLKIRNGKPGCWEIEWSDEGFIYRSKSLPFIIQLPKRKTG